MEDNKTTIEELKSKIVKFTKDRDWDKGADAKSIVMSLAIEAAELMEIFQWTHTDKVDDIKKDEKRFEHLKEEIADVFWYLLRLCAHFDIDLAKAVEDKAEKNNARYPAKQA
ncbi:TPA: nucleotide pyrophosphohydrolase [bacterium]|nr:nucleotide pyrophosphohydrolase [bacterium]